MRLEDFSEQSGHTGISGLFSLIADNRITDGTPVDIAALQWTENGAYAEYGAVRAEAKAEYTDGLMVRDDSLTNTSDCPVTIRRCLSRFALPGNEYDVYTQYSGWINESRGAWQPLQTGVVTMNRELRTNENASPVLALWNRQTNRGIVFHVFANCSWVISANVQSMGQESVTVVECGVYDAGLQYELMPQETLRLPKIIVIPFEERRNLGCDRLHTWFQRAYPKKYLPVICNTWMMTFDRIDIQRLMRQVDLAAEMGAEYFVVDAGWFGNGGRWHENIGAWEENRTEAFAGHMQEFSEYVRAKGMKFGLWLEVERALQGVRSAREHPEWYFYNGYSYLLDFGNADALQYITDTVLGLIDRYKIDFIKSDFNDSISYDPTGNAFLKWHRGHEQYMQALRKEYPDIYLENCSSGGLRMELYSLTLYDSCWISDNHSPYDETRIQAETLLRMPPSGIEKWPVLQSADGFLDYGAAGTFRKIIACHDATWGNVQGLNEDWLRAYAKGGVLGFSFDLLAIPEETRSLMADIIRAHKAERDFYRHATALPLCDTQQITAVQYTAGDRIVILVFAWRHAQRALTLYPQISGAYEYQGQRLEAGESITITCPQTLHASEIRLQRL